MVLSDSDRDLLTRCLAGVDGAWESFVDRYLALMTHVVTATGKLKFPELPGEIRDDLVAEVLLALVDDDYAILRRFRGQSSLGTYLVVVSRRIAARRLSKMGRIARAAETPSQAAEAKQRHANGSVAEQQIIDLEHVHAMLASLPATEATAIRLFHFEHRSYSDIGQRMGIPENSVGPLLSQARDRMRGMSK